MDFSGMQKHRNPKWEHSKKRFKKISKKLSKSTSLGGGSVNSLFWIKSDDGSRNHPNGLPDSKMSAQASKNTQKLISRGVKKHQKCDLLGCRNEENVTTLLVKKSTSVRKKASRQRWYNKQIRESILDILQIIGTSQVFPRILMQRYGGTSRFKKSTTLLLDYSVAMTT